MVLKPVVALFSSRTKKPATGRFLTFAYVEPPAPGVTSSVVERTVSGEVSRSLGYFSRVSLMLVAGTGEFCSETPVPTAVISCQPTPSPSQLSFSATVAPDDRSAVARRSQTSRPTLRLMAPGRSE